VALYAETKHEAVIEVATTRFSGLYMAPILSDYQETVSENNTRNLVRFVLFGIAMFSFFGLMVKYAVAIRKKLHSFWMPVMIFFILIRMMLTSEFYSFWQPVLFFDLSYESTNELMYFTTFVLKYLLIFLVQEQCGIAFTKMEKTGLLIYYTVLYFVYLLVPQSIYNQHLSVLVPMLTYVLDVYLFFKVYLWRQTLKKFGMVIFWGAIFVIAGMTIDSYYINGKIYMNMSLTLMLFFTVFSIIMSWVYAMRTEDIYDDFIQSFSQLELAKNQIDMQKEYYKALSGQMNEIREMKHDIRHFIGAMSRLVEESKFDELKKFLKEYGEKGETKQLPVFCENVVANSIIGYYYLRAKESGIPFESRCNIGRQTAMSDSDLCIVLGNALENAIEACRQNDKSEILFVSVEAETIKRQWLLKVKNSYNGQLDIRNGRCISSKKGKSHGLGIRNIEKVAESYSGFIKIEHDHKEFVLMVAVSEN
jgi:signal transduction histidine kinase